MDLGLGNLATVKGFVLPESIAVDTQYDSVLQVIASGIAKRFENYCNRKFARVVGDVATFDANRTHYNLPRYPLETVTQLELRATWQDPWDDITNTIVQVDEAIGQIFFGVFMADSLVMMQCTYTGGFFYETKEPTDEGYPTAMPEGATALPADLQGAWLMQTLHEFQCKDRLLPEGLADKTKSRSDLRFEQMQLLPEVANAIEQYRRYQIT
jgi:hypothetical protein